MCRPLNKCHPIGPPITMPLILNPPKQRLTIQKASMVCHDSNRHQKSMQGILEVCSSGQCLPGNLVSPSHDNSGLFWTVSVLVKGTAGPVERLGALQTLICAHGETQTMSHIVESCPLTKLNGGLSQLHVHAVTYKAVSYMWNCGHIMN